ncbi:MAG: YdeI/OmpD-associated family protein [Planctomycetota bacterium]
MASIYQYAFETKVAIHDFGRMAYHVAFLPVETLSELPLGGKKRLRIAGEINGHPYRGGCLPAGEGKYYLILSKAFLKSCRCKAGDRIFVQFSLDDPDAVDVPKELQFALDANPRAADAWQKLTSGKRRGLAYRVATAKRAATRENRVEEVMQDLLHDS